jgi:hypothetical protein
MLLVMVSCSSSYSSTRRTLITVMDRPRRRLYLRRYIRRFLRLRQRGEETEQNDERRACAEHVPVHRQKSARMPATQGMRKSRSQEIACKSQSEHPGRCATYVRRGELNDECAGVDLAFCGGSVAWPRMLVRRRALGAGRLAACRSELRRACLMALSDIFFAFDAKRQDLSGFEHQLIEEDEFGLGMQKE